MMSFRSLVLAALVSGCAAAAPPRDASPVSPGSDSAPVERRTTPASSDAEPAGEPTEHHVRILESTPTEEHEIGARVPAPVLSRLEECHHGGPGKLRVRVRNEAGRVSFEAQPSSTLDPTERKCALQALSALRRDDLPSTLWSGATVPATGNTPLLTIEW